MIVDAAPSKAASFSGTSETIILILFLKLWNRFFSNVSFKGLKIKSPEETKPPNKKIASGSKWATVFVNDLPNM